MIIALVPSLLLQTVASAPFSAGHAHVDGVNMCLMACTICFDSPPLVKKNIILVLLFLLFPLMVLLYLGFRHLG